MMSRVPYVHRKQLLLWNLNILAFGLSEQVYENSIFCGMEVSPPWRLVGGEGILMIYLLTSLQQTSWLLTHSVG